MKMKYITIALLGLIVIGTGCSTLRKGIDFADRGIDFLVSVKDPVLDAARTVVDGAENLKTNTLNSAKATASVATQ